MCRRVSSQSTILTSEVVPLLKRLKKSVALTASTGVAAIRIHGQTIHSFAGVDLCQKSVSDLVQKMHSTARTRWRSTDVIIIDEISMVSADFFDKLDAIGRRVRGRPQQCFGGIQLIVCGDFLQLPPVATAEQQKANPMTSKFAFEAKAWAAAVQHQVRLDRFYRQTDQSFLRYVHASSLASFPFLTLRSVWRTVS